MTPLVPCPACRRHVRCSDAACPFCASPLPSDLDQTLVPLPHAQRERWAAPVLVPAILAAIAAASVGCTAMATKYGAPPVPPPPDDAGANNTMPVSAPAYGAPPPTLTPEPAPQKR